MRSVTLTEAEQFWSDVQGCLDAVKPEHSTQKKPGWDDGKSMMRLKSLVG